MNNFRSSRPRVSGSPPTRRDLLRAGALGLGLPTYLALSNPARSAEAEAAAPRSFGKARSCIVIFAWGGLSHIDTFDLKPEAGSDIKSAFGSIPTTIPGYHVCEHLPGLARQVRGEAEGRQAQEEGRETHSGPQLPRRVSGSQ